MIYLLPFTIIGLACVLAFLALLWLYVQHHVVMVLGEMLADLRVAHRCGRFTFKLLLLAIVEFPRMLWEQYRSPMGLAHFTQDYECATYHSPRHPFSLGRLVWRR